MFSLTPETWISIFMAFVTTASAVVTYAVYRNSTDPFVIVFAKADLKRPSFINLVIKNIGKGPAHEVEFCSSQSLPSLAWGIERPSGVANPMLVGPLISGVPFLAPDQEVTITWGQYGGLLASTHGKIIYVDSCYYRSRKHIFSKKLSSYSSLDIKMFQSTDSAESGYGPDIVQQFKYFNGKVDRLITLASKAQEQSILNKVE